ASPDPSPGTELVGIVGGHDAAVGAWPWQVGLWFWNQTSSQWSLYCGGSLIHSQWVLTAAHCIPGTNPVTRHFKVQLGQLRPSYSDSVQVARIIRHPKYRLEKGVFGGADVALLKLEAPVQPSNLVSWIRLPPASLSFPPGTRCWVTGWGDIAFHAPLPPPYQLQEMMVPIVGNRVCNQCYQNSSTNTGQIIKDDMLCAGSEGQDSCQGGTEVVGTEEVGMEEVGSEVVGTDEVGMEVVGTEVVGTEVATEDVGTEVVWTEEVGTKVVGTEEVGTEEVGTEVLGTDA
ncbi:Mastin, partial [Myotis davidii]